MSKNDNYIRDAKIIVENLDNVCDLNVSSFANLGQAKSMIEQNEGRMAFTFAKRADVMYDYQTMQT